MELSAKMNSKKFLSFRILAKFLRLSNKTIPAQYLATEYYQSLWNTVPRLNEHNSLVDLVNHPSVLVYFTSSDYVLRKLN